MKILELFSGIGGFAKGLQQAGFEFTDHYFSEVYDKNDYFKKILWSKEK